MGRWAYLSTSWEENGATKTLGIGGDVQLGADGRFEQNRRIGSVYDTATGTWRVEGKLLHLDSTFEFALGEAAGGPTLTLAFDSGGTRSTYALRKSE